MDRLSRRQFVQGMAGTALLAGCGRLAGPAPSPRPKPATVPRLGWLALASLTDDLGAVPLLEAFREVTLTVVSAPGFAQRHVTPLSPLQQHILTLLGVSPSVYSRLTEYSFHPPASGVAVFSESKGLEQ